MKSESPTVLRLQNEVERLQAHNTELQELLITLADKYCGKMDSEYIGPYSTRLNFILGKA